MTFMKKISRTALILAVVYLFLFILAFAYHVHRHEFDKFSTIFVTTLTAPWSSLLILAYTYSPGEFEIGYMGKNVALILCAFINIFLILLTGRKRT